MDKTLVTKNHILTANNIKECYALIPNLSIKQIASEAGVSRGTVSRAVNGHLFNRKVYSTLLEYLKNDMQFRQDLENFIQNSN